MNIDTELMFECLIYLNLFYYPVFATCETIMTISKYYGTIVISNEALIQDGSVIFTKLAGELTKILLFRRFKDDRRKTVTALTLLFTLGTIAALCYSFFIQSIVLKLEHILNTLTMILASTEVVFGTLDLLPCCHRKHYY